METKSHVPLVNGVAKQANNVHVSQLVDELTQAGGRPGG